MRKKKLRKLIRTPKIEFAWTKRRHKIRQLAKEYSESTTNRNDAMTSETTVTADPLCGQCNGTGIVTRPYILGTPYQCVHWHCDCRRGVEIAEQQERRVEDSQNTDKRVLAVTMSHQTAYKAQIDRLRASNAQDDTLPV